jgi:hypothetical protein
MNGQDRSVSQRKQPPKKIRQTGENRDGIPAFRLFFLGRKAPPFAPRASGENDRNEQLITKREFAIDKCNRMLFY